MVYVSAVRLTPRSLVPQCRPFFHSTARLLSVGGLLLTAGRNSCEELLPRCSSFSRLRLSGGRDLSPAVGHRRYIPPLTLPARGRGTRGMPHTPPLCSCPSVRGAQPPHASRRERASACSRPGLCSTVKEKGCRDRNNLVILAFVSLAVAIHFSGAWSVTRTNWCPRR